MGVAAYLQRGPEGHGRLPVEVAHQLPVVEIALEDDEARGGQRAVQPRVHGAHPVEAVGVGPEGVGVQLPAARRHVILPAAAQLH